MQVNLEGYILYNAAMNSLLLFGSGRLSGMRPRGWRILLSACFGTAYAVLSGLAAFSGLQAWYAKLLCALAMTAIAFLPQSPRVLAKAGVCFFVAAFLLGGTGFSLMYLLGARGYGWNIAALVAALGAAGCVALAGGAKRAKYDRVLRDVSLTVGEKTVRFRALVDTGNNLSEALSGAPVLVVERAALGGIETPAGRPVAFSSMGGKGIVDAFFPDGLKIDGRDAPGVAVAAFDGKLSGDGRYVALLPWSFAQMEKRGRHWAC